MGASAMGIIGRTESDLQGELTLFGDEKSQRDRRAERRMMRVAADLRRRGTPGIPIQVMDLSTDGFRGATHLDLHKGQDVWLRLPSIEPLHGTVAWTDGFNFGCAFERPLHPAVLDMLVSKVGGGRA